MKEIFLKTVRTVLFQMLFIKTSERTLRPYFKLNAWIWNILKDYR